MISAEWGKANASAEREIDDYGVQGAGYRAGVEGMRFRVSGLGVMVQGLGYRV